MMWLPGNGLTSRQYEVHSFFLITQEAGILSLFTSPPLPSGKGRGIRGAVSGFIYMQQYSGHDV